MAQERKMGIRTRVDQPFVRVPSLLRFSPVFISSLFAHALLGSGLEPVRLGEAGPAFAANYGIPRPLQRLQYSQLPQNPPCSPACEIRFKPVALLGKISDAVLLGNSSTAVRTQNGSYAAIGFDGSRVIVFDSTGHYVRSFGRRGDGPAEFRRLTFLVGGTGDTIYGLDSQRREAVTMTTGAGVIGRIRIPGNVFSFAPLQGNGFLVQSRVRTRMEIGLPLHEVSPNGRVLRSFGAAVAQADPSKPVLDIRLLSPTRTADGSFWIAHMSSYEFELWANDGRLVRSFSPRQAWFVPWSNLSGARPDSVPPQPFVVGIYLDRKGVLWAVSAVADEHWRAAPDLGVRAKRPVIDDELYAKTYDTIVEAFDPETGVLIARARYDRLTSGFVGDGLLSVRRVAANGAVSIEVLSVQLAERMAP